ncbi:hypothetical protein [Fusibacter sp. 3D3]|uniref:hypothetical protein n=1 Tax=Fusibacter sp. 3D3 TaxID=1048380 RepID=UPI000852EE0A|nr:hypothetical protein [Fusibacter sp. 3D3]GAU79539.1 hypothetical protein F3D3_4203 [Fusibacter sp. 3D3]
MHKSESTNLNKRSKHDKALLYGRVDERTKQIVNQGDAYMGRFALFAILIAVMVRGLPHNIGFIHDNWDLMGIVIIGSFISTAYQIKYKVIFNENRLKSFGFIVGMMGLCAIIAFIAVHQFL